MVNVHEIPVNTWQS